MFKEVNHCKQFRISIIGGGGGLERYYKKSLSGCYETASNKVVDGKNNENVSPISNSGPSPLEVPSNMK